MTKLKKGQLVDKPVQTQFGWHVIQVDDTRPVEFPAMDQVRPQLEEMLRQQNPDQLPEAIARTGQDPVSARPSPSTKLPAFAGNFVSAAGAPAPASPIGPAAPSGRPRPAPERRVPGPLVSLLPASSPVTR